MHFMREAGFLQKRQTHMDMVGGHNPKCPPSHVLEGQTTLLLEVVGMVI